MEVPTPGRGQVLIKVMVAGANPKDWRIPLWIGDKKFPAPPETNQGEDAAGIVIEAGPGVTDFVQGDRVAAFHTILEPHGTYAEYTIAEETATFLVPPTLSFKGMSADTRHRKSQLT